jgi:hypothetical protein
MADRAKGARLFALYAPSTALEPILEKLSEQGLRDEAVNVLTTVPWRAETIARWGSVPLFLITILAGLIGIGIGLFFAAGTAALYPLKTGGKPIIAWPVVGIISYETMMLLAVVVTFVVLLIRLIHLSKILHVYDARIDDGYVGVVVHVESSDPRRTRVEEVLRTEGLTELRTA